MIEIIFTEDDARFLQANCVFAEYIGLDPKPGGYFGTIFGVHTFSVYIDVRAFKFESDWNWLIAVWKKWNDDTRHVPDFMTDGFVYAFNNYVGRYDRIGAYGVVYAAVQYYQQNKDQLSTFK